MIPDKILDLLIKYSFRNKNNELEIDLKKSPQKVVEYAKEFNWQPFKDPNLEL